MGSERPPYGDIYSAFERSRIEKENEHHYLRNIVDHVGIGLISFRADGEVELYNEAARRIFLIDHLRNISELSRVHPDLPLIMERMHSGQQRLFKALVYGEMAVMTMRCSVFSIRDHDIKLISFQNIVHEMEGEEIESWQKLIKVLTHEIVNSVTPVNSITSSIIRMLEKEAASDPEPSETLLQSLEGLRAVERRNTGLIAFINAYRNLTRIPKPVFAEVRVSEVLGNVSVIMQAELGQKGVGFDIVDESEGLIFQVDAKLIEQVLINLLRNAARAVKGIRAAKIELRAYTDSSLTPHISVTDNGCGIPEDELDKVFIPFFTTSEDGSGIGLSLSRQIMRLHKGSISVRSEEGKGSTFILRF